MKNVQFTQTWGGGWVVILSLRRHLWCSQSPKTGGATVLLGLVWMKIWPPQTWLPPKITDWNSNLDWNIWQSSGEHRGEVTGPCPLADADFFKLLKIRKFFNTNFISKGSICGTRLHVRTPNLSKNPPPRPAITQHTASPWEKSWVRHCDKFMVIEREAHHHPFLL